MPGGSHSSSEAMREGGLRCTALGGRKPASPSSTLAQI
jgi:hypothetical protein